MTPNALNGGKAGFPEYHNVYIEPGSYEIFKKTGEFPEGTIMFKELQLTLSGENPDGSRTEPSGRGYFPGPFNGADVTVKDTKRYADTGGWGYYNFNHHEPKAPTAALKPKEECAYCHIAHAKKDEVWTQFYRLLDKYDSAVRGGTLLIERKRETVSDETESVLGSCILALLAVASAAAYAQTSPTEAAGAQNAERVVDAEGNLRVPADYRTAYQLLGSWAVADDKGQGSKEIHVVFASPGAIAAYRKDGHFPDDSVLVKEVFQATTGEMTTGTVSHAEALKGWFVMVKDTKIAIPAKNCGVTAGGGLGSTRKIH